jgi:hypothetical protein
MLGASRPASVSKLHRVGVSRGDSARLIAVVLPALLHTSLVMNTRRKAQRVKAA